MSSESRSATPPTDLHLCRICFSALEHFLRHVFSSLANWDTAKHIRHDVSIHIKPSTCSICHLKPQMPLTVSFQPSPSPAERSISPTIKNEYRVVKQPQAYSSHPRIASATTRYYCRIEGCNRGPGGRPFPRKDNRNSHEKTVLHGKKNECRGAVADGVD